MNVFKFRATSMVRAYLQYRLSKPLIKTTWQKQNVNYSLEVISALHIQYQCYHITPAFLKKKNTLAAMHAKIALTAKLLDDITITPPKKKSVPTVEVWNGMKLKALAIAVNRDVADLLDALYFIDKEQVYDKNDELSTTLIFRIVKSLGSKCKVIPKPNKPNEVETKSEDLVRRPLPDESQLLRRHPVVTIMGHVDHGKTTLLDALRNTSVVESEFGGITQHIGAFDVTLKSGERVTFLDTPGHAAFRAMRYRGAHVTDIIVLVVAADDGVKDQTLQSIKIAKEANVPVIVAINKIDKPNIDIETTLTELAKHDVITEDLGGNVQCIKVSALKAMNLEDLTEAIVLQAELMNLKADFNGLVEGVVVECRNDIGRGKLVTALIQHGTLRKGCLLVSGLASAKVRAMFNDSGSPVLEAKPANAVQIIGWKALPNVGDEILEVENDKILNRVLKFREKTFDNNLAMEHKIEAEKRNEPHIAEYKRMLALKQVLGRDLAVRKTIHQKLVETERERRAAANIPFLTVNVIIKGDVAGSVETLLDVFNTYTCNNICHLNVVHYGVGAIAESDLDVAETFKAIIYCFNVSTTKKVQDMAKTKGIILRKFNVIYKLIDDIKQEIDNVLPMIEVEQMLGEAVVLQQFNIKDGKAKVSVAGCRCVKGVLLKSEMYHVVRNGENIYTGKLVSMRYLKEEVSSIEVNLECGLRFEDSAISFQPGDTVVCFKMLKEKQKITWDTGF